MYSFDGEEDTETSDEDIAPPGTTEGTCKVYLNCILCFYQSKLVFEVN